MDLKPGEVPVFDQSVPLRLEKGLICGVGLELKRRPFPGRRQSDQITVPQAKPRILPDPELQHIAIF